MISERAKQKHIDLILVIAKATHICWQAQALHELVTIQLPTIVQSHLLKVIDGLGHNFACGSDVCVLKKNRLRGRGRCEDWFAGSSLKKQHAQS